MNDKSNTGFEILIQYIKIFGFAALGLYLYSAITYLSNHFSDFVKLEINAIKFFDAIVARQAGDATSLEALAGVTVIIPAVFVGIAFIVFCIWIIYKLITKIEKWVKEFREVWQEVGKCHWFDSLWNFFKCLGGVLYALVYTVVFVLLIIFCIIVVLINIVGVISLF